MDFLPMPREVVSLPGAFRLRVQSRIVLENTQPGALLYAQMVQADVRRYAGLSLPIVRGVARAGDIALREDATLTPGAYTLDVSPAGVQVRGGDDESVLHGAVTLGQWVQRHGGYLPSLHVADASDMPTRGYYLDCSRGRVPTLETLKRYADLLCRFKINQWQLYIEHTYLFAGLSEAWREDTPLTAEEILSLDAYCRARHIELVPSLASFGHMYRILRTQTCNALCELPDSARTPFTYKDAMDHHTLNAADARALPMILSLIDEYRALFTSRKFNICCDETFDLGRGRGRNAAQRDGEQALYLAHVVPLMEHLLAEGITPMFWGDIMLHHPQTYAEIPKGVVCLNWHYDAHVSDRDVRTLAEMGATQIVCPGVRTWDHWTPELRASFDNIQAMCAHGRHWGAVGVLNTDWGDYAHICHPWLAVPGILYGAAMSWNAQTVSFEEMNRAVSFFAFGDEVGALTDALCALDGCSLFPWRHAVNYIQRGDKQALRAALVMAQPDRVQAANASIDRALDALCAAAPRMDEDKREIVQAVCVAAEGMRLLNEVALILAGDAQTNTPQTRDALAQALEHWFCAYSALWRTVSKESGLATLGSVIHGYADLLRDVDCARRAGVVLRNE